MTTEKRIDRKSFLASTVAAFSAVTLGSCADEGNTGGTEETGGASTGGTGLGGTGTGGLAASGAGQGGASTGGSVVGGTGTGGSSVAGTTSSGGTGGDGGSGGDGGGGGSTFTCTTETNNGMHSHPLTVPSSDVARGYQDAPYVLEDGGTGHTHTLEVTAYDFLYIQAGSPWTVVSSSTLDHTHDCAITCVRD